MILFNVLNVQKYAKNVLIQLQLNLKKSPINPSLKNKSGNTCTFKEIMKFDADGKIRVNEHTLYMDSQRNILSVAKDAGFIMLKKLIFYVVILMTNIYTYCKNRINYIFYSYYNLYNGIFRTKKWNKLKSRALFGSGKRKPRNIGDI